MYPTGSNGASQAIIDARVIGREILKHDISPAALASYDQLLCRPIGEVALRNRGAGPFGLLQLVEERGAHGFEHIDEIISPEERIAFMRAYQQAAGFAKDSLNAAPRTIAAGASLSLTVA
jgi:hypothetical protein